MTVGKDTNENLAKPLDPSGLIDYQAGSVVSKTILKREKGSLTLFAFDEGEGLSEHTVPFDAIVHILDGEAEITISGQANLVGQGELIIMPANQPHALKAVKRFKMLLIMLKT